MSRIKYILLFMSFGLLLNSCSEDDEALVFEHEKNQFELQSGALLVELITPRSTLSGEAIYIVGDFNGGESAVGDDQWKLSVSPNTSYRQGIYLDPSRFVDGKTLSDGYRFVASQSGEERLLDCSSVSRNQNVAPGDRLVCEVEKWASACEVPEPEPEPDGEWPAPEEGKIMLRLELPEYTPENARILLYGAVNGWDGSDASKWQSVPLSATKHYFMLDPADFAEGSSLADQFKFGLMVDGLDWWYHQSNEDGGSEDGIGYNLTETSPGQAYELEILGWRMSSELIASLPLAWPDVPADKIMLRILLPENTPENPTILLYGNINGWDGSDETKWATTELEPGRHYMMLDPADFAEGTSLADQFKCGLIVEGFDWWYHQDNLDGGSEDGPGHAIADTSVGNFYEIEIVNWRSSSEL